ncbi:hypothetical protein [Phenylobacterium sp.]|uniref:hypothetical protein n=1 Tax=Phenylobacterium sp. TaxID=1871053 RepID=UPI00391C627A
MSDPIRVWLAVAYAAPFRVGGWAFVRRDAAGLAGLAAGERRLSGGRAPLLALAAALKDLPKGAEVELVTSDAGVAATPRILAPQPGEEPPTEDLDLWAQLSTALKERGVRIVREAPQPGRPLAFAAAWAEQARERAKNGPFAFAIPKPNLARSGA